MLETEKMRILMMIWNVVMTMTASALHPWPMSGHDTRRSGQSEYVGSQSEYLAWTYSGSGTNKGTAMNCNVAFME